MAIAIDAVAQTITGDSAIGYGWKQITLTGDYTLTGPDASNRILDFAGSLMAAANITFPAKSGAVWIVYNHSGQTLTLKTSGHTGATLSNAKHAIFYCDGTDIQKATSEA